MIAVQIGKIKCPDIDLLIAPIATRFEISELSMNFSSGPDSVRRLFIMPKSISIAGILAFLLHLSR